LVEAYRVLRDEKKRRQYDLGRGRGDNANQGPSPGFDSRRAGDQDDAAESSNPAEAYAIGVAVIFAAFALSQMLSPQAEVKDRDPHPRRLPSRYAERSSQNSMVADNLVVDDDDFNISGAEKQGSRPTDTLIRAFYDPFFDRWYKIPEGYEAPSGSDLTSWHNKRTDPLEWSRLHAEGKLSQIIPRGGLQVRYLPSWQAHEPIIVGDPFTGKTVSASTSLPPRARVVKEKCDVQF
jgi:curved DNA-binding protein CbpA